MNPFWGDRPETIDVPDLHLSLVRGRNQMVVHAIGQDYVFNQMDPGSFLQLYRTALSLCSFRFEPLPYEGEQLAFSTTEATGVTQNVVLSLLQMHIHHNVPAQLASKELDHPNVWEIVLRHAKTKYEGNKEYALALAAHILNQSLNEFALWARVEEDRQNLM